MLSTLSSRIKGQVNRSGPKIGRGRYPVHGGSSIQNFVPFIVYKTERKNRIQNCINGVVNIGIKQSNGTDFIGSGFFIMDDSFDGLVQKVKDKRMVFQNIK